MSTYCMYERVIMDVVTVNTSGINDLYLFLDQSIEQRKTMSLNLFGWFVDRLLLPPELVETFKDAFEVATTLTRYTCILCVCVCVLTSIHILYVRSLYIKYRVCMYIYVVLPCRIVGLHQQKWKERHYDNHNKIHACMV